MQIVTDRGMDLEPSLIESYGLHVAPLRITFHGKTYASGVDIQPEEFYEMFSEGEDLPLTSQPSSGEFAQLYRELAKTDPEILSIHMSSGLSGTLNSARTGAEMVPEAHVTFFDTKTLSCPCGWQVDAAARAMKAGWSLPRIISLLEQFRENTEGLFTLSELKYLIHGGRISHLKGLLASLLAIKPVIGVDKVSGKYINHGQEITVKRSISKIITVIENFYPDEKKLRVQLLHGKNPEAVEILRQKLMQTFDCTFLPTLSVAPALGAHTGPSLVGLAVGPEKLFEKFSELF
jgi:DegV family protein with EDD domain